MRVNPKILLKLPVIAFFLIILAAIILRTYMLDVRPFHFDEVVEGLISFNLYKNHTYAYDPSSHGPSLYYFTAFSFYLFGDSDFTARIVPAFFGVAMILIIYPLRKVIGTTGFLVSAAFFAFSPTFVYYSRFLRHDILFEMFLLSTIVCLWMYNFYKKYIFFVFSVVSLGLLLSTKEEAIPIAAVIIIPLLVAYLIKNNNTISSYTSKRTYAKIILSLSLLSVILILMYSSFFENISGLNSFAENSFLHWFQVQGKNLFLKEWGYYFNILLYERIIIGFGVVGLVFSIYKRNLFMQFISYWFLVNFLMFSFFSYKMPWLLLHILTPSVILSGYSINELIKITDIREKSLQEKNKYDALVVRAMLIFVLVLFTGTMIFNSRELNFYNYANPTYYDNARGIKLIQGELLIEGGQPTRELSDANKFLSKLIYYNPAEKLIFWGEPNQFDWYFRNYNYSSIDGFPVNPLFFENKIIVTNPVVGVRVAKYLDNSTLVYNYKIKRFNIYSHLEGNAIIIYDIRLKDNLIQSNTRPDT